MNNIFLEISLLLMLASFVSIFIKGIKQPMLIGYILTGVIVGPYVLNVLKNATVLEAFSEIGVTLLLFIVGLNLSIKSIKEYGKTAVIIGLLQVLSTFVLSLVLCSILNFSLIISFYISVSLCFSSTIIVLKMLSDKKELKSLHGKLSSGVLLVQDIVAMVLLIAITTSSKGLTVSTFLTTTVLYTVILLIFLLVFTFFVLPKLIKFLAKSQELLFLFSISYGMSLAVLFYICGLSAEIGALIAGITLTFFPYHTEISAKLKSLRDFFITLFFVFLGTNMILNSSIKSWIYVLIFSIFTVLIKPIVVMIFMGLLGYKKRTSFMTGFSLAQVSEFSLIIVNLGFRNNHINSDILSMVTMVGIVSILLSSYIFTYSSYLYHHIYKYLSLFESNKEISKLKSAACYEAILFGYNRTGFNILKAFNKLKLNTLVVDYDPEVVNLLKDQKIDCKYGDADDIELFDEIDIQKVKIIVSTLPDVSTNSQLIRNFKKTNRKAIIIVISQDNNEANELYSAGATYVMIPHYLGSEYVKNMIEKFGLSCKDFEQERKKHLKYLVKRL